MHLLPRLAILVTVGLALAGCSDDGGTTGTDAGPRADAGPDADAYTGPLAGEIQLTEATRPWGAGGQLNVFIGQGGFPRFQGERVPPFLPKTLAEGTSVAR